MKYEEWKKWWQDQAPTYFTDKIWKFSQPMLIDRLNIQKTTPVLEIGFGYGRELFNFCRLSDSVCGVELSEWSVFNVKEELQFKGITKTMLPDLRVYDGKNFPAEWKGKFDVIYSCFVIQHLSREHAKELIRNALDLLSTDGRILFEFFGDPSYYLQGEDVFSGIDGEGGMYNNAFVRSELEQFISDCGGRVLWVETTHITRSWGNHWVCFYK